MQGARTKRHADLRLELRPDLDRRLLGGLDPLYGLAQVEVVGQRLSDDCLKTGSFSDFSQPLALLAD